MTANNNMKSPGYNIIIKWLSIIWNDFAEITIKESFVKCGITSQTDLHSALNQLLEFQSTENFSEYVVEIEPCDDIDGLDPDAIQDIFDNKHQTLAGLEEDKLDTGDQNDDEEDETL